MATILQNQHEEHADHSRPTYFPPLYWAVLGTLLAIVAVMMMV
ncbi:hypothetical protein [Mucisphaera sp.]